MSEYCVLYWAAACLVFWAGGGVTKGQMAQAVDMVCNDAKLTIPQEVLLKDLVQDLSRKSRKEK